MDFSTGLNDAIKSHYYPLPLPDEIFATQNGRRFFSQVDFEDAYLQIEVDDCSRITDNQHTQGFYRHKRLPFLVRLQELIFQKIMDTMLTGLKEAVTYLEDVIVVGCPEHKRT